MRSKSQMPKSVMDAISGEFKIDADTYGIKTDTEMMVLQYFTIMFQYNFDSD